MPFQGNPNAGQPDPALLNLLFQQKARREEMAYKQQQDAIANQMAAQAAAAKEARDAELHKLKVLEKRATLTDKLRSMASDVDSARRNAEQVTSKNFTESDLLGGGGGEDFASIVAQNDPTTANQLDQSNAAQANLATQLSMGSELQQQLAPGIDQRTAVDATLGMGGAFEANRQRKAEIKAAEYDRQVGVQKDKEIALKRVEDKIRDQNVIDDVVNKGGAEVDLATALQRRRNTLRGDIKRIQANGGDTSDLEEQVGVINGRIASIREPRTVVNKSPIPFEQKVKLADGYTAADYTINRARDLWEAYKKGELEFGVKGALEDVRLKAGSILQQIVQVDPNIDPETRGLIQDAIDTGSSTVKISDQLSLGLDQILMTYGVARSGRGSVRFAVAEIKAIAQQFNFTGIFTTPEQIQGGLRRAAQLAAREKALNKTLMSEDPEFQSAVTGIELLPEDQRALEFLGSISKQSPPAGPKRDLSKPVENLDELSDQDLEAMFPE